MEIEDVYKKILKQYGLGEELLCEYLYRRSYEAIVEILTLSYWKEAKFQPLLTSSIWGNNVIYNKKIKFAILG